MRKFLKSFTGGKGFCVLLVLFFSVSSISNAASKIITPKITQSNIIHYDLTLEQKPMNISGKKTVDFALSVNGTIPAPILKFTEGDIAEIVVHNNTKEETSIHWHGLLVPSEMDGVPYVTTPSIMPGADFTFKFPIRQNGTYWYHSHTHTQEQRGVFGAIVIEPRKVEAREKTSLKISADTVLVLSDWIDENPDQVIKNIHKEGNYYLNKKGTQASWLGAMGSATQGSVLNYLSSEWSRMGAMDFSDIGYDAFLINGQQVRRLLPDAHAGQTLKFRIINAGASTFFHVSFAGLPFQVIAADGKDIKSVMTKELFVGMAETYDVLFTVPENKSYEIRASAQDGTGFASALIGQGKLVKSPEKGIPNPYAMNHAHHHAHTPVIDSPPQAVRMPVRYGHDLINYDMPTPITHENHETKAQENFDEHATHEHHDMHDHHEEKILERITYDDLVSLSPIKFPEKAPRFEFTLELSGDMNRYNWFLNGKTIAEDRTIQIHEGDVIKFNFVNKTMMHHPIHLHGHFFKVLRESQSDAEHAPLKHTVDVPPFETQSIEFLANEPGEWMLHCHNLYHMMSGMARVVKYENYTSPLIMNHGAAHDPHQHDPIYWYTKADAFAHVGEWYARVSNTRSQADLHLESRRYEDWKLEVDTFARRWLGNYTNLFLGAEYYEKRGRGLIGVQYLLPLMIQSSVMMGTNFRPRVDVLKRFHWTGDVYTDAEVKYRWLGNQGNSQGESWQKDIEWSVNLMYSLNWNWAAGLRVDPHSAGFGLTAQF